MNHLLTRFFVAVIALVIVGAAVVWFAWEKGPSDAELNAEAENLHRVAVVLERDLRERPVAKWWPRISDDPNYASYWIEFQNLSELDKAMAAVLSSGDVHVNEDSDGYPVADVLVQDTDQVLSIGVSEGNTINEVISRNAAPLLAAISAIGIPILFFLLVMKPLNRSIGALEVAAKGFASGNFSSRIPAEQAPVAENLGQSLNTMASEIETLVARNETILDDQREMLRAVAHEFRGPLARIRFALDMTEDAKGQLSPELNSEMGGALDELDLLVGEVLSYARLQPGSPMLNLDDTSFERVVIDAMDQASVANEDVIFESAPGKGSGERITADAYFLQRAILNLMHNGARHATSCVRVAWFIDSQECVVTVEDDGEGIPVGWRPRIFDPFVRVDPSRSRHSGGVGLGLAIVKRIMEKHSGLAEVDDSTTFSGARFTLRWPVRPADSSAAPNP